MNEVNKIKELIYNYHFPYDYKEREELCKILGKIINILYGGKTVLILDNDDISFLNMKKLINTSEKDILMTYHDYLEKGNMLNNYSKNNLYNILVSIGKNLYRIDEEWKNNNVSNLLFKLQVGVNNLNSKEIKSLVNIIMSGEITDSEKEDLLIYLSLNLVNYKNKSL